MSEETDKKTSVKKTSPAKPAAPKRVSASGSTPTAPRSRKKIPAVDIPVHNITAKAASRDEAFANPEPQSVAPKLASPQDRVIDALLNLMAYTDWNAITLQSLATEAGLELPELRALFPSKGAALSGFARRVDMATLKAMGVEEQESPLVEPPREKLAHILKIRFRILEPHKEALRRLRSALATDPVSAVSWNKVLLNSAQWMLAASGYEETGLRGNARAQGLVLLLVKVMPVWLNDDHTQAATAAAIDAELTRANRWLDGVQGFMSHIPFLRNFTGTSSASS